MNTKKGCMGFKLCLSRRCISPHVTLYTLQLIFSLLLAPLSLLQLGACEDFLFESDMATNDPYQNFEYLWRQVDQKYSYFETKNIDWDHIHDQYAEKLSPDMSEEELFNVLGEMLNELRDDHTNLISPFDVSMFNIALQNPDNIYLRTILKNYLTDRQYTGGLVHGYIKDKPVAYVYYSSFVTPIDDEELDYVMTRYKDTEGMIIDVRGNGGGAVMTVPQILSRFIKRKVKVGYFETRSGKGRDEFGPAQDFNLTPYDGITYNKPVVILIDRGSYSATTMFALAAKALPNITLIGDKTGGGGGSPNGGQLPNGWFYRFSVSRLLDLTGDCYAEEGVPPDIPVQFDWTDLETDEIVERAMLELNQQKP